MPRCPTAAELAELTGLLAAESARRAAAGDTRDKDMIVDAILNEMRGAPTIPAMIERLRAL